MTLGQVIDGHIKASPMSLTLFSRDSSVPLRFVTIARQASSSFDPKSWRPESSRLPTNAESSGRVLRGYGVQLMGQQRATCASPGWKRLDECKHGRVYSGHRFPQQ